MLVCRYLHLVFNFHVCFLKTKKNILFKEINHSFIFLYLFFHSEREMKPKLNSYLFSNSLSNIEVHLVYKEFYQTSLM